ncbi:hypothetical protein J2S28_003782 [Rhizobium sp. SLBN-94]|nr:hypothetical protein [Rhizobium sp. SLBN-94]
MKIESRDLSVDELFTANYFFIPRFQRPYSWEDDNIVQFWNDVVDVIGGDYFIGSMVVYRSDRNALGVVDGQQRLTTITILLCTIRNVFETLGDRDSAEGLQQYIERRTRENKNKYVLETETSFPYLQEHILKFGEPEIDCVAGDEERAIERAENVFKSRINDALSKIKATEDQALVELQKAWLRKLRDTILDLKIILITLDSEDDAYLIFETLNTRGKDLSLSDLLKNLFTKNIKEKGDVDYAKLKWANVLETLYESDADLDPDTFVAHSWASRYEAIPVKRAFPKLKAAINARSAHQHLNDFARDARFYRSIFEPSYLWSLNERGASTALEALRMFKVEQPAPGLLSLVRAFRDDKIKFGKLVETLQAIENFHFAFTAITSSRSSGGISGMYSSFGRKLFEAKDSNSAANEIRALVSKLRQRRPTGSEFNVKFESVIYTKTHSKQRGLIRYILMRLQQLERTPVFGAEAELTIEHLYPQADIDEVNFPHGVVGQIGNLLLVDSKTNELLKDKSFVEKKKILSDRGYVLPPLFLDADKLTPDLIAQFTQQRAELANNKGWGF